MDKKGKGCFSAGVGEEARCVSTWYLSIGFQVLFQSVICDAPGLIQDVHAFPDLTNNSPFTAFSFNPYWSMMSWGMSDILIHMYSYLFIGVPR